VVAFTTVSRGTREYLPELQRISHAGRVVVAGRERQAGGAVGSPVDAGLRAPVLEAAAARVPSAPLTAPVPDPPALAPVAVVDDVSAGGAGLVGVGRSPVP
jgi:hypothetical protein